MYKQNQNGSSSVIAVVLLSLLLVGATIFGGWAYMSMQDYKNNSDKKAAKAVDTAKTAQKAELDAKYAEENKNPNKTYQSTAPFGSITFKYPKTWSAYVDETNASTPVNGYFHPDKVPGLQSGTAFALRVELVTSAYSGVAKQFDSQIKAGKVKAIAYLPPKMNGVANAQTGIRFDGPIARTSTGEQQGSMVVLPVRDKTLKIYTLSRDYLGDFNNIVLTNLSFVP